MTEKKNYQRPERLAGLEEYAGAGVTVRFVAEPAPRGEQSLAALDMARNFDALPDMEQDRLQAFVESAWKRQEGDEKARQEAQRRFERMDWLVYVVGLRHEGWTLGDLCRHMGETEAEAQSLDGITQAVEAWLQSEQQKGEQQKSEARSETEGGAVEAATPPLGHAHAGTPGEAYLAEFLPGVTDYYDADWLMESINSGALLVCPRCHFLRLQNRPFPLETVILRRIESGQMPAPADDCDVCLYLPASCELPVVPVDISRALAGAAEDLVEQRKTRAMALHALWEGTVNAADALLWARMADALEDVRKLPQTGG